MAGFRGEVIPYTKKKFVSTPEIENAIWDDYYNNKMKNADIMKKYDVGKVTFFKIIKKKREAIKPVPPVDPREFVEKKNIDALARTVEFKEDAQTVVEATMALMAHHLRNELEALRTDPKAQARISVKDLTAFFAESAPYVLPKIDSKKGKDGENQPLKKINTMFKNKTAQA